MKTLFYALVLLMFSSCQNDFKIDGCYHPKGNENFENFKIIESIINKYFNLEEQIFVLISSSDFNKSALIFSIQNRNKALLYNFENHVLISPNKKYKRYISDINIAEFKELVEKRKDIVHPSSNIVFLYCIEVKNGEMQYNKAKSIEYMDDGLIKKCELRKLSEILNTVEFVERNCLDGLN